MKESKIYLQVSVEEELPEKNKIVTAYSYEYSHSHTFPVALYHDGQGWQEEGDILDFHGYIDSKIDFWLKPLDTSLQELMVGFAEWVAKNYVTVPVFTDTYEYKRKDAQVNYFAPLFKIDRLLEIYLTENKIILR